MPDYDFSVLSPHEFECLCRDLLERKENVFIESFTDGKDDGIDLRYAKVKDPKSPSETVIVQVKKYKESSRSTLISKLRKNEAPKLRKLHLDRYYFMTSIGLTPKNKADIQEIFRPYIKRSEDIFGRDDLNNLLGLFPTVVEQYDSLRLAGINGLEEILNRDQLVRREMEEEEIKDSVRLYVGNKSFNKALDILKSNHFVIISGIPGIGKTILARILVHVLVTKGGFDEFWVLDRNTDVFFKMLRKDKKQVFLFDDFLGTNVLDDQRLQGNGLREMISSVCRSENKLLILTTLEALLQDALSTYEWMTTFNIKRAECFIESDDYSEYMRAEILYNHLIEAKLPIEYIENLLDGHRYIELIKHPDFNPRVIQEFISGEYWKDCAPDNFAETFKKNFENSFSVWEKPFLNRNPAEQCALLALLSMGQPVFIDDWKVAFKFYYKVIFGQSPYFTLNNWKWGKFVDGLRGTFIKTRSINEGRQEIIEFQNHSVSDFLMSYGKKIQDCYDCMIRGAWFIEQLYTLFSDSNDVRKLKIPENLYDQVNYQIKEQMKWYRSCELIGVYNNNRYFYKRTGSRIEGLKQCADSFPEVNRRYHFVEQTLTPEMLMADPCPCWVKCELLAGLDWSLVGWHVEGVLGSIAEKLDTFSDYTGFIKLCSTLNQTYRLESDDFVDDFWSIIHYEEDYCQDRYSADWMISELKLIHRIAPNLVSSGDIEDFKTSITETIEENEVLEEKPDKNAKEAVNPGDGQEVDIRLIDEMFSRLR